MGRDKTRPYVIGYKGQVVETLAKVGQSRYFGQMREKGGTHLHPTHSLVNMEPDKTQTWVVGYNGQMSAHLVQIRKSSYFAPYGLQRSRK